MSQIDWVSESEQSKKPFKDIRNTKPTVAEEKAEKALRLGRLLRKVPQQVCNGSVQTVRAWKSDKEISEKVAKSPRSSVHDLDSAIFRMMKWASE